MQVLFSGDTRCSEQTLKRLVTIADEIGFSDRPSVKFAVNAGTVGHPSIFRRLDPRGLPIKISVYEAAEREADHLYAKYFEVDTESRTFRKIVWQGLQQRGEFARKVVPDGQYSEGSSKEVLDALLADTTLLTNKLDEEIGGTLFGFHSQTERNKTFKTCLFEASIQVTNAMVVAERTGLIPVSDDPLFCQLLQLRMTGEEYAQKSTPLAGLLGLAIARSVLPDQLLERADMQALFEYRRIAQDVYAAWSSEVERLSLQLQDLPPEKLEAGLAKVMMKEVEPKLNAYHAEMASSRDKLFGDLVSKVTVWAVPTMTLASYANLPLAAVISGFALAAIQPFGDYAVKRRDIVRKNGLAYIIGISKNLKS